MAYVLGFLLGISLGANAFLAYRLKSLSKKPPEAYDARQLLHDLTAGAALVKVTRVAPENVLLRSPRDSQ